MNEEDFVNENKDIKMGLSTYYIGKIQSLYFLGEYAKALEYVPLAEENLQKLWRTYHQTRIPFLLLINGSGMFIRQLSEEEKNKYAQPLRVSMDFIKHCSEQGKVIFQPFHYLVEAEMARISGKARSDRFI